MRLGVDCGSGATVSGSSSEPRLHRVEARAALTDDGWWPAREDKAREVWVKLPLSCEIQFDPQTHYVTQANHICFLHRGGNKWGVFLREEIPEHSLHRIDERIEWNCQSYPDDGLDEVVWYYELQGRLGGFADGQIIAREKIAQDPQGTLCYIAREIETRLRFRQKETK